MVIERSVFSTLIFGVALSVVVTATPTTPGHSEIVKIPVIPTGVFLTQPAHVHDPTASSSSSSTYDEYDDDIYVPFRSDIHDHFSWELLKQVLQEEPKNVVISPFSVKLALAILSEAAGNNSQTQRELISTLTDIKVPDNLRGFYKKTLASLKKESPYYTLNLETKLYTDAYIEPRQRYAAMLYTYYNTEIQRLQFADSQNAAKTINDWGSNITHGRLQHLVHEDNIQNNVMLLANVIYFNGLWRVEFNSTYEGVFMRTLTDQMKVNYMEQTGNFYFHDSSDLDVKILRLPYKGKKFSMFILLPKNNAGLDEVLRTLQNEQVKRIQWMMDEVKVKVTLPKFKFDYNKNLKQTLMLLGIRDIFTDDASLPGLARGAEVARKLKVSNIFQKAGIDVNEKGTEAYASTVVEIENKFGGSNTIEEFNVNRPFIFLIEEETSGNIIFAGKVLEPHV